MSKTPPAETSPVCRSKASLFLLLGLSQVLLFAASGCRTTSDNQIDLLERELRVQEDYIYELEDYIVEYSEKLRDCRSCPPQQMAAYSEELSAPSTSSQRSTRHQSGKEKSVLGNQRNEPSSPAKEDRPEEVLPEDLELPEGLDIEIELDDSVGSVDDSGYDDAGFDDGVPLELADDGTIFIPDPADYIDDPTDEAMVEEVAYEDADYEDTDYEAADDNLFAEEEYAEELFADEQLELASAIVHREAERLEITQLFSSEGGELSPLNLLTVVEALDANDEPVDLDGEVSLMVMTVEEGRPQRLKRWNFTAAETIESWQSSDLGDGLHLELPLEATELPDDALELWVRLVTADGRKLLTQLPFEPNSLNDIAAAEPKPRNQGLALVEVEEQPAPETKPVNSLRIGTTKTSRDEGLQLVDTQQADTQQAEDQPRWRASMHRTDHTSEGFATTSNKSNGWTKQAPGQQPYVAPQVASRQIRTTAIPKARPATHSTSKPAWTEGRVAIPATPMTNPFPPTRNVPASWSPSR